MSAMIFNERNTNKFCEIEFFIKKLFCLTGIQHNKAFLSVVCIFTSWTLIEILKRYIVLKIPYRIRKRTLSILNTLLILS